MNEDDCVLDEPAPPDVRVTAADSEGIKMTASCWVRNENWLTARSDLWIRILDALNTEACITMARPQQEVFLKNEKGAGNNT